MSQDLDDDNIGGNRQPIRSLSVAGQICRKLWRPEVGHLAHTKVVQCSSFYNLPNAKRAMYPTPSSVSLKPTLCRQVVTMALRSQKATPRSNVVKEAEHRRHGEAILQQLASKTHSDKHEADEETSKDSQGTDR